MSLSNLLQYLLKEGMDEVAKSIGEAQAAGFAIYRDKEHIIIFEPKAFFETMESMHGENALANNVNALKQEMQRYTPLFPQYLLTYKAGSWENELNLLLSHLDKFQKTNDPRVAGAVSNVAGNIQGQYWQLYSARAKSLRGQTKERYELNKEKEGFEKLLNRIRDGLELKTNPDVANSNVLKASLNNCIRGYIKYKYSKECAAGPETYQVDNSAALKGWGPLTYDITMSVIHPAYLISDRGSNSSDADKVWMYYLNNRPDVHKELMEELITGEDCDLPTSSNEAIKKKLKRAQNLLDQRKGSSPKSDLYSRQDLEETIEDLQRSIYDMTRKGDSQDLIDIAEERIEKYQAMLDDMPDEIELKDEGRLEDVIEEMKKILADVPQAWRYQIANPIDISTMDNRFKLFVGKVKSLYGRQLTSWDFQRAGSVFFDVNYTPGD